MNKPLLIVLEGVDGTGKTTLAKRLAASLEGLYLYNPQPPFTNIRKEIEATENFTTRFFYYLAANIAAQALIEKTLAEGKSVVVDRYIYSTFLMHQHLGVDTSFINMSELPIRWPDLGIVLTTEQEIRGQRLAKSREGTTSYDENIESRKAMLDKVQNGYKRFCELNEINTSYLTLDQAFERIIGLIVLSTA